MLIGISTMGRKIPYVKVVRWEKESAEPETYHPEIVVNGISFMPVIYERERFFYTNPAEANTAARNLALKLGVEARLYEDKTNESSKRTFK